MASLARPYLTPEQYLEIERKAETKSEYYCGEMFAMAGASSNHCILTANFAMIVGQQLRGRPCIVYSSDMGVRVSQTGLYTYPDVTAVRGEPELVDSARDTLLNHTR